MTRDRRAGRRTHPREGDEQAVRPDAGRVVASRRDPSTVGEDGLPDRLDRSGWDPDRFLVSNADEAGTARRLPKAGALGLLFVAVPARLVVFG